MFIKILFATAVIAISTSISQADVVINEIMKNPSEVNDSDGEWFELFNTGSAAVDINGWTIEDDGSDTHVINNGGSLVIDAGGYLVLGNNSDFSSNGGLIVDYQYGSLNLSNGTDEIVLLDLSLAEIDRVNYDDNTFPDFSGLSAALLSAASNNNVGSNWYSETVTSYGDGDFGTPGARNTFAVPEPTSISILGLCFLGFMQRRRRNA